MSKYLRTQKQRANALLFCLGMVVVVPTVVYEPRFLIVLVILAAVFFGAWQIGAWIERGDKS